jgi:hypothetical protein
MSKMEWNIKSWIYNYLCNQCLSPLTLWVRTPLRWGVTQYNMMWYSLSVTCDRSVVFSGCTTACIMSCQLEKLYHYSTLHASRSNTAFPTDETWYKQLYIHNVYISWQSVILVEGTAIRPYHYETREASSSDTAFPTDETWYKQLYIHFVYLIRLSNIFMIKHKKNHVSFIEFIIWRKVKKEGLRHKYCYVTSFKQ